MSPDKKPTKPIDIYVRVSRTGGRDTEAEGGTAAEQEKRCRAYLTAQGIKAGKVFPDLDQSGGKTSRPALDQLKARIASGQSGGLIALNMSRFGRNRNVAGDIIALTEQGAEVMFVEDRIDTASPQGTLMLDIISAFNTYYLANITKQWASTRKGMVIERKVHGGACPAGYVKPPPIGKLAQPLVLDGDPEDPDTPAGKVRLAFEKAASGRSWTEVAECLRGIPTLRGETVWTRAAARGLVGNPVYTGQARSGSNVLEGAHPEIVDGPLYKRANRKRSVSPARVRGDGPGAALGGGLLRCGTCKGGLVRTSTRSGGKVYPFYVCRAPGCSRRAQVMAGIVEPWFQELALDQLGVVSRRVIEGGDVDTSEADARYAEALAAADDAAALIGVTVEELPASSPLVIRLLEAETERELAIRAGARELTVYADFAQDPQAREAFAALPADEQRRVYADLVSTVTVEAGRGKPEDRITIEWKEAA